MKFCTSCQADKPSEGGERQQRGKVFRWICKGCLERRSPSPYKSHNKEPYPNWRR